MFLTFWNEIKRHM